MGNFVVDLAHGETQEQHMLAALGVLHPKCKWIKADKSSRHLDLICTHCADSIEVKSDRKAATTGNLCFERNLFYYTKSRRIIYICGNRAYVWETAQLMRDLLVLVAEGKTKNLYGGDRNANALILVPLELITASAEVHELKGK